MATLKQGTTLAKKIRKAHPKMKWVDAVKAAHKQLNKGHRAAPAKRKVSTVKKRAAISAPKKTVTAGHNLGSLAGVKFAGLTLLKAKYGKLSTTKALAKTKTEKKKLAKEMAATLRAIKNIHSI